MEFCFQVSSTKFRDLARRHGVSPNYMDYLASDYAIRNGLGEREMLDIMYGDQRKKSSKDFAAFLKERALDDLAETYTVKTGFLGREETVNRLPKIGWSNPIYDRLNDLRGLYNGRPVDSIPDDELNAVKTIFPVWKTAQGQDGVERLVLMMPEPTADRIVIGGKDYTGYVPQYMDKGEYWLVSRDVLPGYNDGTLDYDKAVADGKIVKLSAGEYQKYRDEHDLAAAPDPLEDPVGWWQTVYRSTSMETIVTELDRIAKMRMDALIGPGGEGTQELSALLGTNAESAAAYAQMHQARQTDRVKAPRGAGYLDGLGPTAVASRRGVELTEGDRRHLAELTAVHFSILVDRLMAPGKDGDDARAWYLGLRTREENAEVLGMTRKAFIQKYGVGRLMEMVRDRVIDHNPMMSVDASIRAALFNRNWRENMRYASHTLIENEGFSMSDLYVGYEQLYDDIREADGILLEYYSNGDVDSLGKPDTAISTISRVSRRMRRFLSTAEMYDKSGKMIVDRRGYGVQAHTDGRNALNFFYDLLGGCADLDEMTQVLRGAANPICDAMLRQIAADPNFASDVATLFRQNRMEFGITEAYMGEDGVLHYRNRTLSKDMVARKLQSDVMDMITVGRTRLFRLPEDTTSSFGRGTVDRETFDAAMRTLDRLIRDYGSGSELGDAQEYANLKAIADCLGMMGFGASGVDIEVVRDMLREPEGASRAPGEGKAYRFVQAVRDLLDCFDAPDGKEILLPFASESSEGASKEQEAQVRLRKVCDMLVPYMRKRMELMVDANGQRRYVIGLNRYMGDFMRNVDLSREDGRRKTSEFLHDNFTSFRFFNPTGRESDVPHAMWWRSALDTQMGFHENISFNGAEYGGMSGVTYISNMLAEYFGAAGRDEVKGTAAYAFSSGSRDLNGFITQRFYRMGEYEVNGVRHVGSEELLDGLMHLAIMDLQRMRSVALRSGELVREVRANGDGTYSVEFYDGERFAIDCTDPTIGRKSREAADSGSGNIGLVREDLVENGRMKHGGTGLAFRMLRFLNSEIIGGEGGMTELGIMMLNYINTGKVETELAAALKGRLATQMDEHVASETGKLRQEGLYGTQKARVRYGEGKDGRALYVDAVGLRFMDAFISESPEETMARAMSESGTPRGAKPDAKALRRYAEMRRGLADEALREFIWNDYFARSQSFLITAGDPAQFRDSAELYKRMLGITSPGRTSNEYAKDFEGKRVSDGYYRVGYIANNMRMPTTRESVLALADRGVELAAAEYERLMRGDERDRAQAAVVRRKMNYLRDVKRGKLDALYGKQLDTTEGQSWTSPTGMRKKLFGIGAMEVSLEQAFLHIRSGDYSYDDIVALFQVLKPVVVTHERARYCEGEGMSEVKNFTYHKTSEVMLALAGAAVKGDPNLSVLEGMYEFMEESHWGGANGNEYRTDGIDTLLAASSVKCGAHGVADISGCVTKEEVKEVLRRTFYNDDGTHTDAVHRIRVRDYRVQQENPAHFHDHEMNMPTQVRPQAISDIEMAGEYLVRVQNEDGAWVTKRMSGSQVAERYWGLLRDNIRQSVEDVKRTLNLNGKTHIETNQAVSERLREYCEQSAEYGPDMFYALSLDENGEFNVPPDDYVMGAKFQNLVNAYLRKTVNMQKVPGGPVVQTTQFGMSDQLSIRFKDAEGRQLMTFREFFNANAPDGMRLNDAQLHRDPASSARYGEVRKAMAERYIREVLGRHRGADGRWVGGISSLDHIEAYLNIPTEDMRKALFVRKGSRLAEKYKDRVGQFLTVEQALEEKLISEEQLKCIASRVPVEDKYSMLPIKIVGFMSDAGGELIVLPDEVTLLTGCDFDVDKLFVMTKSFRTTRSIEHSAAVALAERYVPEREVTDEEVRKAADEHYAAGKASKIRGEAYEESLPTVRRALEERAAEKRAKEVEHVARMFEKIAGRDFLVSTQEDRRLEDFFRENYDGEFSYRFDEETGATRNGRNNEVFDLMWSTLTSEHNMDKLFDPGGFENVKRMTNIMKIMSLPDYAEDCRRPAGMRMYGSYGELLGKSLGELEGMLARGEDYDPFALSTAVHFQRENVGGRRMVGWTANNVTAHAFLSPLGLRLNPRSCGDGSWAGKLWFGGKRLSQVTVDPMVGDTGEYVSRTLSSYLAASVDSPKYETLSAINFNQFTGNAYMFLLRCGFDERLVISFMSLPSIRELARIYEVECHDRGFVRVEDVIDIYKSARCGGENDPYVRREDGTYEVRAGFSGFDSSNGGLVFDIDQVTSVFEGRRGSDYVNYSAVDLFRELRVLGDELSHISSLTKLNTLNGAPGSTLGDIFVYAQRVTKYLEKYAATKNNNSIFDPEVVRRIIDSNPVLKEFYESIYAQNGYVNTDGDSAVGLAEMIYTRYTPCYNPQFVAALRSLQNGKCGSLSAEQINEYAASFTKYALFSREGNSVFTPRRSTFVDGKRLEMPDYFVRQDRHGFIARVREALMENDAKGPEGRNALLDALRICPPNDSCPVMTVWADRRGMSETACQDMREGWLLLYRNRSTRRLATDLFCYAMMQNGCRPSGRSLDYLVPAQMKHELLEYRQGITSPHDDARLQFSADDFYIKHLRNHTSDRTLVPRFYSSRDGEVSFETGLDGRTYARFAKGAKKDVLVVRSEKVDDVFSVNGKSSVDRYADVVMIDGRVFVNTEADPGREPKYVETGRLGADGYFFEMDPAADMYAPSVFERFRKGAESHEVEVRPDPADDPAAELDGRGVRRIEESIDWSLSDRASGLDPDTYAAFGEIVKGSTFLREVLETISSSEPKGAVFAKQMRAVDEWMNTRTRGKDGKTATRVERLDPKARERYRKMMEMFCD